jgi:hypothetical protein
MKRMSLVTDVLLAMLVALTPGAAPAQDKPLKKVIFAITTKDISVGHAAHSSLPVALGYWKEEGLDVAVMSVEGSAAASTFKILPRSGKIAWKRLSRPDFAVPPADSPSTINNSLSAALLD